MPKKHVTKKVAKKVGRPRAHRATAVSKTHPPDRSPSVGHEERLAAYVKRALLMKRQGCYHHEIAEGIALEFDLPSVPAITTVADWLKKGNDAVTRDIQELQWQMRIEQFGQLEKMKGKWLPLALAANLEVTRWVRVEGELQPELDENAVKEQIEATKQVVAIMARQAKLLGLDIEKSISADGEGPGSLQELQVWLIGQVNLSTGAPNGQSIDIQAEVLELRSGLEEVDSRDANAV